MCSPGCGHAALDRRRLSAWRPWGWAYVQHALTLDSVPGTALYTWEPCRLVFAAMRVLSRTLGECKGPMPGWGNAEHRAEHRADLAQCHCLVVFQPSAARGRQRARPLHGRRALGRGRGLHRGLAPQGAVPPDARHLRARHHAGQAGDAQRVPVPRVQDAPAGADVRLDVQPQDARQAHQVDAGWHSAPAQHLSASLPLLTRNESIFC